MSIPELCSSAGCVLNWIERSEGVAAWFQGIGTIIALSVTVWTVHHQARLATRREVSGSLRFLAWIEEITEEALVHFAVEPAVHDVSLKVLQPLSDDIRASCTSLLELPATAWPTPKLRQAFWRFDREFDGLVQTGRQLLKPGRAPVTDQVKSARASRYLLHQQRVADAGSSLLMVCAVVRRDLTGKTIETAWGRFSKELYARLEKKQL